MQIGKGGLKENFFNNLSSAFKTHNIVKIHILKSAGHNRENVKEINGKILDKLGAKYTSRIIGFTVVVRKWRKEMR